MVLTIITVSLMCGCNGRTYIPDTVVCEYTEKDVPASSVMLTFPMSATDSPLIVEKLIPYQGPFWEDGSGAYVQNVAGLMLYNPTDRMIAFVSYAIRQGDEQLYFFAYQLPPQSRCLVLEYHKKVCVPEAVTECRELCIRWENQEFSREQIDYVGLGPLMTIVNRDIRQLKHVTVWYKRYVKEEDYYLGGVAYSAHLFFIQPDERRTIQPEHYNTSRARIVGIQLET